MGARGLLLLAVSGIVSGALATYIGPLSWAHLLVAPGVQPPWWATLLPIALGTGAAVSGPGPLRKWLAKFTSVAWRGTKSLVLVVLAAALISIWAISEPIADALSGGAWWQVTAALLALSAIPLALIAVMVLPQFLLRRAARSSARSAAAPAS